MSRLDRHRNSLEARIVYWGAPASGKTETLAALQRALDPEGRSILYSLAGSDGATVYFDVLPLEEFRYGGQRIAIRLCTVPGGVDRAPERRALLRDADGIVFVADGSRSALGANRAAARELEETLQALGRRRDEVPMVWCLNKQDLGETIPPRELREMLVPGTDPVFETAATEGHGVFDAFQETFRLVLQRLARRHGLEALPEDRGGLPQQLLPQLARAERAGPVPGPTAERQVVSIVLADDETADASRALDAMLSLTDVHAAQAAELRLLEGRNVELSAVNRVARSILSAMEVDNLLVVLLDATLDRLGASHAGVVMFDPSADGALKTHVTGFGRDPALGLAPASARRFFELMRDSDGPIPADPMRDPELLEALRAVDNRICGAVFQPLKLDSTSPSGWIGIYRMEGEARLNASALLFLSSISRLAALGLDKIGQFDVLRRAQETDGAELQEASASLELAQARLRALNRGMESRVRERTRSLDESLKRVQRDSAEAANRARMRGMSDLAASFVGEIDKPIEELTARLQSMADALDEMRATAAAGTEEERQALVERHESLIGDCAAGTKRVSGIVDSLRRLGGGGTNQPLFSLNAAVADAVTLLEHRIQDCAQLDLRLGKIPDIVGDAAELSQVVMALLTNALEAIEKTGNRGNITLTTYASTTVATLRITDDGIGIDPELLPRICEPFVTTKQGQVGAGLGLHAAHQALEAQGGEVRIKSDAGHGASITVEFALVGAAAQEQVS